MFWEREIQLGEIAAGPKMGIPLKKNKRRYTVFGFRYRL